MRCCSQKPQWLGRYTGRGLSAETLVAALAPLEAAFQFGPDTPSFMQDFDSLGGDKVSIASLLPEVPGAQTTKFNKDHFIKRGVTNSFCPHCAALALFSLQLNAPAGGKGYRTGLRGGGPLTTLIELQEYEGERLTPLWRKLWLNVLPQDAADMPLPAAYDESVFPWLAPTRTSEQASAITTPEQVDKLQAYWGMPAVFAWILPPLSQDLRHLRQRKRWATQPDGGQKLRHKLRRLAPPAHAVSSGAER